jgi:hypothetical protein
MPIKYLGLAEKVSGMPALPIGRQVQSGRMKMYAYTSNEPNKEDGMPEASLKISDFEIFKCTQIKLDH